MENNNFDEKLVAKLKEEHIAPKPRWHFLLKDYVLRAMGVVSLLIGAGAVAVMIYLFKYNGWEIQEETNKSLWEFFLLTLPYFWIIFLALFIFILYYNLHHTKRGYRYPIWVIVTSSILASIILGSIFFFVGLGEKIDNVLGERVSFYHKIINRHVDFWFSPAEGRLTGIISDKDDDESHNFSLIDPDGEEWDITVGSRALPIDLLPLREPVDLIGRVLEEKEFQAEIIRPSRSGRGFLSRPRPRREDHCRSGACSAPVRDFRSPVSAPLLP